MMKNSGSLTSLRVSKVLLILLEVPRLPPDWQESLGRALCSLLSNKLLWNLTINLIKPGLHDNLFNR